MSAKEFISIDDDILTEVPIDNVNDIIQRHTNNDSNINQNVSDTEQLSIKSYGSFLDTVPEFEKFAIIILTSRFEATRRIFWDGPRNVEPRSEPRTIPDLSPALRTSVPQQWENVQPMKSDLMCSKPKYTAVYQRNRVSNLEPSRPKVETLSLCHCGLRIKQKDVEDV
ncbi:hypothetical protein AVEN_115120-1 [Araneus ventricosus]|uniref:Uncharacterized protein n=1 Tax=Araneus ventricosus TaxID=182803 RepID=A0A4Y1ZX96_ARAVE|nr:hypothetical protein AVEN_115120-1 [Araneus ventricosus]